VIKVQYSLKTVKMDLYKANLHKLNIAVGQAAANVEAKAKASIETGSGKYREYQRPDDRIHWSSPPNTAPNNDYGGLANEFKTKPDGHLRYRVDNNANYAVPLELGHHAKSGSYVAPRPFMVPALQSVAPVFKRAVTAILKGK
jgi:hypothetical protein